MQLLPKHIVVAYALAAPAVIDDLSYKQARRSPQGDQNLAYLTSTKAAVHHKPTEDRDVQMTRHKIVESKDFLRPTLNWQEEVIIPESDSEYPSRFIDNLTQISFMWNGYHGRIRNKHRIELLPISNPDHTIPDGAGPTVRVFRRLEIEKILSQNVIEPALTE